MGLGAYAHRNYLARRGTPRQPTDLLQHELIAVSYTHLRAHETVLDIVCRLLLVKNNTKIKVYDTLTAHTKINTATQQHVTYKYIHCINT